MWQFCFQFFKESILFSISVSSYIPTNSCKRVLFSPFLLQPLFFIECCIMAIVANVRWYLTVVLIWISLIMSNAEYIFICLLAICTFILEKSLFRSFSHVLIMSYLYILEINPLSVVSFVIIFSHSDGLLFNRIYCFPCAKAFKFNKVPLVYFCSYFHYTRKWVKKDLAHVP